MDERENVHALKQALLKDFRLFLRLTWRHLCLPEPTPIQLDIADYLQQGPRRCVLQAFRGVGKSWITSAFVCWSLLRQPQLNILVVSASKQRADDFSTFTRRLILEMPLLAHLKPRDHHRDSNISFDVGLARASHAPSVKSIGITGQITGSRADLVIADDVEVLNNTQTQGMRDKLSQTVKEFEAVLKPGGRILYLGTPQTEMSLYHLLGERGYKTRIWPARIPGEGERYNGNLAPFIKALEGKQGQSTDPLRFDEHDLLEREASYGKSGFALQFMLDTSLKDDLKYPLKLSDLVVMDINPALAPLKVAWSSASPFQCLDLPALGLARDRFYQPSYISEQWGEYTGSVMAIDPSGRGKDETGYAVVKMLNGQLFLTKGGGLQGGYELETLEHLASIAKTQSVNLVLIEANYGDGMFTQLLKPILFKHHSVTIEEVKHHIQKERRIIDILEPVLNQHRLCVDRSVIREDFDSAFDPAYKLFYQLTRITREKGSLAHDDRLDALAIAVGYWTEQMAKDRERGEEEHKENLIIQELERFKEHALGYKSKALQWMRV